MAQSMNSLKVYGIYCPKRDMIALFRGPLYTAKKRVLEKGGAVRKSGNAIISGVSCEYEVSVNRRTLRWRLYAGKRTLQKSYPDRKGYYIITRSFEGNIISKSSFGRGHVWEKTAYYEQGNTRRPAAVFSPDPENPERLQQLRYMREEHMYEKTVLYPAPAALGTGDGSILNNKIAEPEFYLITDGGDLCYYGEEELAEKRKELYAQLRSGEVSRVPQWKKDESFTREWLEEEDKLHVGSAYRYHGAANEEGQRHGRGRTEQLNGFTAYEGGYENGKRSGKGVYYYEDGSFCYYGGWKNGRRNGTGITVKKGVGAVHVGVWDAGELSGASAVFDENGVLKNFGIVKDGSLKGMKTAYLPDRRIVVGNWEGNVLTGSGSIFSEDGVLLYSGGLLDGKRNGFGVSFREDGSILHAGEWKNDICRSHFRLDL